jgi:hypothetical protein
LGENGEKGKVFERKSEVQWEYPNGGEDSNPKTLHGRGIDIFWNQALNNQCLK